MPVGPSPRARTKEKLGFPETHPGLGTRRALGINPDVLGDDLALLVELEILVKLLGEARGSVRASKQFGGRLTVSVREMTASVVACNRGIKLVSRRHCVCRSRSSLVASGRDWPRGFWRGIAHHVDVVV